jgi:excisionase family DNA binding protein|tara:strand:- start:177 stop:479 length:303 start_codon:yes stop_codon:yes gene_type:complete
MMNGPFVPIEELSKHFSVSVSTIRAWVRQGHIPKDTYIKVGNTYRFSVDDVSVALAKKDNTKPTDSASTHVETQVGGLSAITTTAVTGIELGQGHTDEDL